MEHSAHEAPQSSGLWPELAGYQVRRLLGEGGCGRVFEVVAPGGIAKAVKVIQFDDRGPMSRRELEGLEALRSIRHPFLISLDRVDIGPASATLVMELADESLRQCFEQHVRKGQVGIPRGRLLALLREAAEALDSLNRTHQVFHLDIKPENLFLVAGHLKVGDYGLARVANAAKLEHSNQAITPAYAAPELFDNSMAPTSDQYSLAAVYVEMLTGERVFPTADVRQLMLLHMTKPPNLDRLPEADRPIVGKALSRDPNDRFETCAAFVRALLRIPGASLGGQPGATTAANAALRTVSAKEVFRSARAAGRQGPPPTLLDLRGNTLSAFSRTYVTRRNPGEIRAAFQRLAGDWHGDWVDFVARFTAVRFDVSQGEAVLLGAWLYPRGAETVAKVTVSRHGQKPDPTFPAHAEELLAAAGAIMEAAAIDAPTLRNDERTAVGGTVFLTAKTGPLRNMPVRCAAVDCSAGGMAALSLAPLPLGVVTVQPPAPAAPVTGRVLRCRADAERRTYFIGVKFDATVTGTPDWFAEAETPARR